MDKQKYIELNDKFWQSIEAKNVILNKDGILLVEKNSHPIISHSLAITGKMIAKAYGLKVGWLTDNDTRAFDFYQSYDRSSISIKFKEFSTICKIKINTSYYWNALKLLLKRDILAFKINGIKFGDILYDTYLDTYKRATIDKIEPEILILMKKIIRNYHQFNNVIKFYDVKSVLVSHQIGSYSGVLLRTALRFGIPVFLRTDGHGFLGLQKMTKLEQVYLYPKKPSLNEIELIKSLGKENIDKEFNQIISARINGGNDKDSILAFNKDKKIFNNRAEFYRTYSLDKSKNNIFVMLHAFNDHPHSHFKRMLFKDYYDWFTKTLQFAEKNKNVNWIFKEHPSSRYYPTVDIQLSDFFINSPSHILFLNSNASFHSASLKYVADAVITTLGTAGVEYPALAGIPSILAGNTFYDGFGFTIEPISKKEYFKILAKIHQINKLNSDQIFMAKLVFLYIAKYWRFPFPWGPAVSYDFNFNRNELEKYYWQKVIDVYSENKQLLIKNFEDIVRNIQRNDFKRLTFFDQTRDESIEMNVDYM